MIIDSPDAVSDKELNYFLTAKKLIIS
jgi:hypothetical protein